MSSTCFIPAAFQYFQNQTSERGKFLFNSSALFRKNDLVVCILNLFHFRYAKIRLVVEFVDWLMQSGVKKVKCRRQSILYAKGPNSALVGFALGHSFFSNTIDSVKTFSKLKFCALVLDLNQSFLWIGVEVSKTLIPCFACFGSVTPREPIKFWALAC